MADSNPPPAKKSTGSTRLSTPEGTKTTMEDSRTLDMAVKEIHARLEALFKINQTAVPLPFAIISEMQLAFKCIICHDILSPPMMISTCCKSIVGCQRCIDTYYSHNDSGQDILNKVCPKCRAPRGYANTHRLLGLDDFVRAMKAIIEHQGQPVTAQDEDSP